MLIKNNANLAEELNAKNADMSMWHHEYADYPTAIESDGYTVIVRTDNGEGCSKSAVLWFPFSDEELEDTISGLQCWADYSVQEGKGKHGKYTLRVDEDTPPLLEDEIGEILDKRTGEQVLIRKTPETVSEYRYYGYRESYNVVEAIWDALRRHYFVTVSGKNILDLY